jgi:8-oxo-dGTP pyrophosphatase MutT (NUDIX family)
MQQMYNQKRFIYPNGRHTNTLCTNCNMPGHSYKHCLAPVNSYGIIAFRIKKPEWTLARALTAAKGRALTGIDDVMQNIEFLLIRRKDSLRFVDFVRGKYNMAEPDYLKQLLSNMTYEERDFLKTTTFEALWTRVWGSVSIRNYKNDFEQSKAKFEGLTVAGSDGKNVLVRLLEDTTTSWTYPEWGFPKGRRNPTETDIECAIREFEEETDISREKIKLVQNMEPLCETFFGDNNVHYCHKYYLAQIPPAVSFGDIATHSHMSREIGDIGWFSIDDAFALIRSENVEKREILLRVSSILRNYCFGCVLIA